MNKLIELFNKKYGDKYGKISYPRTTLQIYRVYQTIKSYGIEDNELIELLHKIELPKPRNTEEWELYVDCLYNKDDSELERNFKDVSNRLEILPVKNIHHIIQDGVPVSQQNITLYGTDYDAYMFNDEQITIPNNLELENSENKFSAICFDSKGLINAVVTYNDGTNDITKEVKLVSDNYFDSEPFNYDENGESGVLLMTFAFDSNTNKFYMVVATYSLNDNSVTSYEVKNVSLSYSYITNLIDDDYLKSINYSKIKNVPYQLNALVDGSIKALDAEEYSNLFDNLFIWDANKINDKLDSTSGVKKNEYYDHIIKVKQKDSEGIGYGQYIPASAMSEYKLFVSAGNDVIVKVYTRKHKVLLTKLFDFSYGEYQEITIHDSYSGTDGIFIAFTVKDSVTDFYANTYVNDLVLCKSSTFLTKQEVNNKVDKVNGKGLSTVDFTTAYETKLKGLENYNDTTIKKDIQTINTQLGDIAKKVEQGGSIDLTDYAKKNEIPKSASDVGADATGTATTKVTEHNTSNVSHNDIRLLITNLTNKLNALADSDDTTLDQLSEIVTYIKNNKSLIDGITTSKLNISDVADNLTTNITNKALSAKQGVELKKLIDAIIVPTKVSQLINDSKFLTSVPAEYITEDELNTKGYLTKHQDISGKVDKVEGKGLSTVDFTTAYETKLKGLSNYNDTIIKNNIDAINAKINTMFSFNDNGELVVTIGEVSKTFVPKSE